jgi:tetratricopeptide (TPR) repeat protein
LATVGFVQANRQRERAEANFKKAREAVDRMLTQVAEELPRLPGMPERLDPPQVAQIKQALLEDALEYYEGFLEERSSDPLVRYETAHAYLRVGDITKRMRKYERAEETYVAGHIAVFRDIHYTATIVNSNYLSRAAEGNPFTLGKDEFFVLGDNSPSSADSRWWQREGIKNNHKTYRQGIVPRDYLIGKALFVYWPGGFEFPWPQALKSFLLRSSRQNNLFRIAYAVVSLNWIPDVGEIRFIYGGSDRKANQKLIRRMP